MAQKPATATETKTDEADLPEGPLVDLEAAALKKLIARGKERGYVTYDELNAALPQDQVSSERIEDVMAQMNELGVNIVENEEAALVVPARFLGQPPSPSVYSPFGGGNRRCLGATFARYEATIVLGTLLREQEIELLDKEVKWGRGKLILEPLGGVRMRVRVREREAKPLAKAS